jgi:hypothetical protein
MKIQKKPFRAILNCFVWWNNCFMEQVACYITIYIQFVPHRKRNTFPFCNQELWPLGHRGEQKYNHMFNHVDPSLAALVWDVLIFSRSREALVFHVLHSTFRLTFRNHSALLRHLTLRLVRSTDWRQFRIISAYVAITRDALLTRTQQIHWTLENRVRLLQCLPFRWPQAQIWLWRGDECTYGNKQFSPMLTDWHSD